MKRGLHLMNDFDEPYLRPTISQFLFCSKEIKKLLKKSKDRTLSLIHNHPKNTTFSSTDILTLNRFDSIKESIIINSKGESYYLSIPKGAKINLVKGWF